MNLPVKNSIAAVIVSYNGKETVGNVIRTISPQVDRVIVVDNASSDNTLEALEQIKTLEPKLNIIQNSRNLGIANALNKGIVSARELGHNWVITLDDDSKVKEDMVAQLLEAYERLSESDKMSTAILAPNYTNLKGLVHKNTEAFFVLTTICSGQLVKMDTFAKVGFFKEDLFIDCVDHEFCLRIKKAGLKTLLVPSAILYQRLGNPSLRRFLWKKVAVANHPPYRYYYTYRNSVYLYKEYFFAIPGWGMRSLFYDAVLFSKMIFFEKNKISRLKMMAQGLYDGIQGKYGKYEP